MRSGAIISGCPAAIKLTILLMKQVGVTNSTQILEKSQVA